MTAPVINNVIANFQGGLFFHPVRLAFMVVWFYTCLYMVGWMEDHPYMPQKHRGWLNVLSLFFAPLVFFAIYVVRIHQQAELEKISFWNMLKKVAAGSVLNIKSQLAGSRGASSIMLLDSSGKSLSEIYGGGNKNNLSGALNLAETIIWDCLHEQASDVLIDPVTDGRYTVRFRIDGKLRVVQEIDSSTCAAVVNSIKALSGMDIAERRKAQDGAFTAKHTDGLAAFRVASAGVMHGEKLSIRVLSSDAELYNVDKLGLSDADYKTLNDTLNKRQGMIITCGPTGSGKTTSLYAMLKSINALERNIITVEDPVEYTLENVSQIEVNPKAGITFGKALRGILRQDPDVICVGEIRDEETAQIAMQAAHTGHLVMATIHSNSNFSAIVRLLDLGVKPMLLASALDVVVSQRLLRTLCPDCKQPATLSEEQKSQLKARGIDGSNIMAPGGCRMCGGTGFKGRVAIFDTLKLDNNLKQRVFADGISAGEIRQIGENIIKPRLRKEAMKKVFEGVTTFAEVKSVV